MGMAYLFQVEDDTQDVQVSLTFTTGTAYIVAGVDPDNRPTPDHNTWSSNRFNPSKPLFFLA